MTLQADGRFALTITLPENIYQVDFVFRSGGDPTNDEGMWDNQSWKDWHIFVRNDEAE
jgi:hypothetical protein